jgi:hypothetical protein
VTKPIDPDRQDITGCFTLGFTLHRDIAKTLAELIVNESVAEIVLDDCETPWRRGSASR